MIDHAKYLRKNKYLCIDTRLPDVRQLNSRSNSYLGKCSMHTSCGIGGRSTSCVHVSSVPCMHASQLAHHLLVVEPRQRAVLVLICVSNEQHCQPAGCGWRLGREEEEVLRRRAGRRCGWGGRVSTGRAWRRSCCPSTPARRAAARRCASSCCAATASRPRTCSGRGACPWAWPAWRASRCPWPPAPSATTSGCWRATPSWRGSTRAPSSSSSQASSTPSSCRPTPRVAPRTGSAPPWRTSSRGSARTTTLPPPPPMVRIECSSPRPRSVLWNYAINASDKFRSSRCRRTCWWPEHEPVGPCPRQDTAPQDARLAGGTGRRRRAVRPRQADGARRPHVGGRQAAYTIPASRRAPARPAPDHHYRRRRRQCRHQLAALHGSAAKQIGRVGPPRRHRDEPGGATARRRPPWIRWQRWTRVVEPQRGGHNAAAQGRPGGPGKEASSGAGGRGEEATGWGTRSRHHERRRYGRRRRGTAVVRREVEEDWEYRWRLRELLRVFSAQGVVRNYYW